MKKQCDTLEKMISLSADDRDRASKVVARSFFRILAKNGFSHSDIMDFAGNLLDEVMRDMGTGDPKIKPVKGEMNGSKNSTRDVA
jgi:hypothetical protein